MKKKEKINLKKIQKRIFAIISIHIIWYLLSFLIDYRLIPYPHVVWLEFFKNLKSQKLLLHTVYTLYRLLSGLILSVIFGTVIGIFIGINKKLNDFITPIIYFIFPLPKIAFVPIFMVMLGLNDICKISILIFAIIFQIILIIRDATVNIDNEYINMVNILGMNFYQKLIHLYIPSVIIPLFSAIRVCLSMCMAVLFFVENTATKYGLGFYVMNNWIMVDYPSMFSGIVMISVMSIILLDIIDFLEKVLCPYLEN